MNSHGQPPEPGDARPSLLIADDDAVAGATLTAQLDGDFRIVGVAADAAEAIQLAEQFKPDAALIDVQMPAGGAPKAVPGILGCSPKTCVVVLSADESRNSVLELLNAGASTYLRKGISGVQLSATIMEVLNGSA